MNLTSEQLTKAKAAKSVEELLALAKESGIELTEEEAAKYLADLHKEGSLSDDEFDNVVGGCGGDPEPKYTVGTRFLLNGYYPYVITKIIGYDSGWKEYYYELEAINGKYDVMQMREEQIDSLCTLL